MFDPSTMAAMLRIALNNLVQDVDPEQAPQQGDSEELNLNKIILQKIGKGEKLGSGKQVTKLRVV